MLSIRFRHGTHLDVGMPVTLLACVWVVFGLVLLCELRLKMWTIISVSVRNVNCPARGMLRYCA